MLDQSFAFPRDPCLTLARMPDVRADTNPQRWANPRVHPSFRPFECTHRPLLSLALLAVLMSASAYRPVPTLPRSIVFGITAANHQTADERLAFNLAPAD
jgi:hypothetical protein